MEQKQINLTALEDMLEELAQKNWAISKQVFSEDFCKDLAHECQNLAAAGQLSKASIGKGASKTVRSEIRGDFIQWLDDSHPFHQCLELIRQSLNQFFFLGLRRVEAHFALYPPGAGYAKHIDNHRPNSGQNSGSSGGGSNHRKITFVLYLNENWQKDHGGELSLYNPDKDSEMLGQVEPTMGTLILFRSDLFPHQVEKSSANRMSLTGWFRDDAL
ncbi:2OG-Fe(II) oxygenase [Bdellovibrio svalbardensis]|uniref:2OG-Fe(II) oxygenase n=1 Tax=Bdellovibrio svalbardensis TaxID=2972972 RepID=A0ABT6DGR9_9BACT|nr:2OG-Fe(II) oxygenase [Bdellovibrio svalbardensis]MDG0816053.1 2OG-Fe(II) oxygenase [Bdellovibrio svalbardensis]